MKKELKITLLVLGSILSLGLIFLLVDYLTGPVVTLNGDADITVVYGTTYEELGATANGQVQTSGSVNDQKIGTYTIIYYCRHLIASRFVIRKVHVIDNTAPTITLEGETNLNLCPNVTYNEPGYQASDDYDGDLTSHVTIEGAVDSNTIGTYTLNYKVSDSSWNETTATREVMVGDNEDPLITLTGDLDYYLKIGDTYNEPGYQATDNCNGDLTSSVTIEGVVDSNTIGTYTLSYKVSDLTLNEATVTRNVHVYDPAANTGTIYLTFDDGPSSYTNGILDILAKYNIKATFFVTCHGSDQAIIREYDEGHTVGLHTCSHTYSKVYASVAAYYEDLQAVSDRVYNLTGYRSYYIRFPGGSSNTVSRNYSKGIMSYLVSDVKKNGYQYYDWNVLSGDTGETNNATAEIAYTTKQLRKNRANMVLMHDIKYNTLHALEGIIKYGLSQGYTFKAIDGSAPAIIHGVNN